jgi:hypothetical protein
MSSMETSVAYLPIYYSLVLVLWGGVGGAISVDLGPRDTERGALRGPCSYFYLGHLVLLYPWACFELTVQDDFRVMFRWTECFCGQRQRVGSVFAVVRTEAQGGVDEIRAREVVDYSFNCTFRSVTACFLFPRGCISPSCSHILWCVWWSSWWWCCGFPFLMNTVALCLSSVGTSHSPDLAAQGAQAFSPASKTRNFPFDAAGQNSSRSIHLSELSVLPLRQAIPSPGLLGIVSAQKQ